MLKNNVYKMRLKYQFIILFSFLYTFCSFAQVSELDLQLAHKYYIDAEYEKAILYYNKIAEDPNYKLKIYKGKAKEYSLYIDQYYIKIFVDSKKNHAFLKKVGSQKSLQVPPSLEDL